MPRLISNRQKDLKMKLFKNNSIQVGGNNAPLAQQEKELNEICDLDNSLNITEGQKQLKNYLEQHDRMLAQATQEQETHFSRE